jgi:nondiscriminating aspartyl-tRNA synthetase
MVNLRQHYQMERTLASQTNNKISQTVLIQGWVNSLRKHGTVAFIDLRDRTGLVQVVFSGDLLEKINDLKIESAVEIEGIVKARGEKYINPKLASGTVEIDASKLHVLASAAPLPFDTGKETLDLELPTLLDHRAITLRHSSVKSIFSTQAIIIEAFRQFMQKNEFVEFQAPSIVPAHAEGGAEVFEVEYFDHKAYLSQSPQLYKQIAMTAFERVFSVNKVFRAEPSVTSRHLTEILSLDAEMAFINSWEDIRDMADQTIKYIFSQISSNGEKELEIHHASIPKVIDKTPTLSLREAQEKIYEKTGRDVRQEKDLNAEDEKDICRIIFEETGSEIMFVYGYPTKKKPFYVYPNPENPEVNEGIDLLCRGLELMSGGRRVNDYQQLLNHVTEWNMDPSKIKMFLEAFSYGVPPEGGFAFGAERITMQVLGLQNIREATMFPRDMERVDFRFSQMAEETTSSPTK